MAASQEDGGKLHSVCVDIVVLSDPKLLDALDSLRRQTLKPSRIMIADGGSRSEYLENIAGKFSDMPLDIHKLPGTPIETRDDSIDFLEEEITVFLDSDEVAPPEWLRRIVEPLISGQADFTGGPTKPPNEPKNNIERYYNELDRKIYEGDVHQDVVYIPLGNTAWKTAILKKLRFDRTIAFRGGAPDYDLEMRAVDAGYKGMFVGEAWVYHNKSTEKGYLALIKHRYRYLLGAAVVLIKNKRLRARMKEKRETTRMPFGYVETAMKPVALVHAILYWNLVVKRKTKRKNSTQ